MCAALVSQLLLAGSRAEGAAGDGSHSHAGEGSTLGSQERVKWALPRWGQSGRKRAWGFVPESSSDSFTEHLLWLLAGPRDATKPVLVPSNPREELNLTLQE